MHSITKAQKILTFMSEMGECQQQKHTQRAPSTKTECDFLNGWIFKKKTTTTKTNHIRKNLTQNGEPQRYIAGNAEEKEVLHPSSWKDYLDGGQSLKLIMEKCSRSDDIW